MMPHLLHETDKCTSFFNARCHPTVQNAVQHVDTFFLRHWPFGNERSRRKFVAAGFSQVTCLYFPEARDDRIELVCRLLTVLFLIDDMLEDMSLQDGKQFNQRLMPLCRGSTSPDRSDAAEWILYDIFDAMRKCDLELANDVLEPLFEFMEAQTSKERLSITALGQYLTYRRGDVGQALLASLTRFSMGLSLAPAALASVADIEDNCGRHIAIVNDIYSFEKEVQAAQLAKAEGGMLCNAVQVLADEVHINTSSAKQVLWAMVREWEIKHVSMVKKRLNRQDSDNVMHAYLKGLEYHMSGNEAWSRSTKRYHAKAIPPEEARQEKLNYVSAGGLAPVNREISAQL